MEQAKEYYAFISYKQAAAQGLDIAQVVLAEYYAKGVGCKKDVDEAIELYKKAASQGNKDAQTIIDESLKSQEQSFE